MKRQKLTEEQKILLGFLPEGFEGTMCEKLVYAFFCYCSSCASERGKKDFTLGYATLEKETGYEKRQIMRVVKKLIDQQKIGRVEIGVKGQNSKYYTFVPTAKMSPNFDEKCHLLTTCNTDTCDEMSPNMSPNVVEGNVTLKCHPNINSNYNDNSNMNMNEGDYTVYLEKNLRRIIREEITCMKHEIIRELKNEIMDMIEEKAKDMRTEKRDNDNDFKIEENDNAACMEETRDTDTVEIDNGFCDFDFNPDEYRGIIYGGKGKKDYKALNDEYSKAYKALTDYDTSTDEKIMAADRITSMLDNDELTQRQATAAKKALDNFNRNKSITYKGWTEESNALREIMMPVLNEWMTTHTHESAKRLLPMIEPMLEFVSKGECPEEFGTIFNEDFRGAAGLPTMLMQRLISEAA